MPQTWNPPMGKLEKKTVLQTRRKVVKEWGREVLGKGGKTFLKKSFSLPSPNPIPPCPKTFAFIESLLGVFPCGREYKREALECAGTVVLFLYMGGSRKDINVAKASVAAVFPMWVGVVIRNFFPLFSKDFCVYRIPAGRFPCG